MCADSQEAVERVIAAGGLVALGTELKTEESPAVLTELCWAISNISTGPSSNIALLLSLGIILRLSEIILTLKERKVRLLCNTLISHEKKPQLHCHIPVERPLSIRSAKLQRPARSKH